MNHSRGFYILWIGLTLSIFGSELTEFSIGLWLLKEQQSVLGYTTLYLILELPAFFLIPFIGFAIDRFDKRKVLILSEFFACIITALVLLSNHYGAMNTAIVYVYISLISIVGAVQMDCYATLVYRIVPESELKRANSLGSLSASLPQMLAPFIGAFLFSNFGLSTVLFLDSATFLVSALATILLLKYVSIQFVDGECKKISFDWKVIFPDIKSIKMVRNSQHLSYLMIYASIKSTVIAATLVSIVPYFTTYYTPTTAGYMMTIGGFAMVITSLLSAWKPNIFNAIPITLLDLVYGISFIFMTQLPNLITIGFCIGSAFMVLRMSIIKMDTIWLCSVPKEYHGRVFAVRNMIKSFSTFTTYFITGFMLNHLVNSESFDLNTDIKALDYFYIIVILLTLPVLIFVGYKLTPKLNTEKLSWTI
ncbi:MFS transporter [Shewanella insulae]|uniref:MFS transporter n=1 Tax=Shewanella insulae TaxID=2681496 RepID=UPI001EFE1495|nr:MFS transporter [Shewanella insulae]MCG9712395.1 MFS transporter [Shewanella insulae]